MQKQHSYEVKVEADRISQIKKDICNQVLIGENQLRSVSVQGTVDLWSYDLHYAYR